MLILAAVLLTAPVPKAPAPSTPARAGPEAAQPGRGLLPLQPRSPGPFLRGRRGRPSRSIATRRGSTRGRPTCGWRRRASSATWVGSTRPWSTRTRRSSSTRRAPSAFLTLGQLHQLKAEGKDAESEIRQAAAAYEQVVKHRPHRRQHPARAGRHLRPARRAQGCRSDLGELPRLRPRQLRRLRQDGRRTSWPWGRRTRRRRPSRRRSSCSPTPPAPTRPSGTSTRRRPSRTRRS